MFDYICGKRKVISNNFFVVFIIYFTQWCEWLECTVKYAWFLLLLAGLFDPFLFMFLKWMKLESTKLVAFDSLLQLTSVTLNSFIRNLCRLQVKAKIVCQLCWKFYLLWIWMLFWGFFQKFEIILNFSPKY